MEECADIDKKVLETLQNKWWFAEKPKVTANKIMRRERRRRHKEVFRKKVAYALIKVLPTRVALQLSAWECNVKVHRTWQNQSEAVFVVHHPDGKLTFKEPTNAFPSVELVTKLILIAG